MCHPLVMCFVRCIQFVCTACEDNSTPMLSLSLLQCYCLKSRSNENVWKMWMKVSILQTSYYVWCMLVHDIKSSPGTSLQNMVFTKLYSANRNAPRVTNNFVQCAKECFVQIAKEETSLCANRSASCVAATLRVVAPSGHCPAPTLIHSL